MSGEVHPTLFIDKSRAKIYQSSIRGGFHQSLKIKSEYDCDHNNIDDEPDGYEFDYTIGAAKLQNLTINEASGLCNAYLGKSKSAFIDNLSLYDSN